MYFDFANVLVFILVGVIFVFIAIFLSRLIGPKKPSLEKSLPYECGEEAVGEAWIQFNMRFYTIALVFLIFDVEVAFILPWAKVFRELGLYSFVEMFIFILILLVGLAYIWAKGDLEWVKRIREERDDGDS